MIKLCQDGIGSMDGKYRGIDEKTMGFFSEKTMGIATTYCKNKNYNCWNWRDDQSQKLDLPHRNRTSCVTSLVSWDQRVGKRMWRFCARGHLILVNPSGWSLGRIPEISSKSGSKRSKCCSYVHAHLGQDDDSDCHMGVPENWRTPFN